MGNSSGSHTSSSSSDGEHVNTEVEQKEEQDCKEYEASCEDELNRKYATIQEIESSILEDHSHENTLMQFSKMLSIQGVNVGLIGKVVSKVKSDWKVLDDSLEAIQKCIGMQEINNLKTLRVDYFSLLLETKGEVSNLCEESAAHEDNIDAMLDIVSKYKAPHSGEGSVQGACLDVDDSLGYEACCKTLQKWIDQSNLETLIQKWHTIITKLQTSKNVVELAYDKFTSRKLWQKVGIALGSLIVIGAIVGLIVATSGAATLIAAGVASTKIGSVTVVTSHLVAAGIGIGVGATVVGGGVVYGHAMNKKSQKVKQIVCIIEDMLKRGFALQQHLSTMKDINGKIEKRMKLTNIATLEKGLTKVKQFLREYQTQGKKVMDVVDNECKKYIS